MNRQSLRASHSFLCVPKEKKRRVVCATPLRKGSPAAETTPFVEVWNRRGKNSLRSDSLPLHPVPHPAARLSGKGTHRPRIDRLHVKERSAGRAVSDV